MSTYRANDTKKQAKNEENTHIVNEKKTSIMIFILFHHIQKQSMSLTSHISLIIRDIKSHINKHVKWCTVLFNLQTHVNFKLTLLSHATKRFTFHQTQHRLNCIGHVHQILKIFVNSCCSHLWTSAVLKWFSIIIIIIIIIIIFDFIIFSCSNIIIQI